MFPLGTCLLPGETLPLRIFEPRYRQMLADCLEAKARNDSDDPPWFGVVLIARGSEVGGGDTRHDVGTVARIEQLTREPDGRAALTCVGGGRFRVTEWLSDDPYPQARIELLPTPPVGAAHRRDLALLGTRVRTVLEKLADDRGIPHSRLPEFGDEALDNALLDVHGIAGWAARVPIGAADRQILLESDDADKQMAALTDAIEGFAAIVEFGS